MATLKYLLDTNTVIDYIGGKLPMTAETWLDLIVDDEVAVSVNKVIEIRENLKIKLPDAIIAATALVHNLTLVSRNVKDFSRISGLSVIDPHTI